MQTVCETHLKLQHWPHCAGFDISSTALIYYQIFYILVFNINAWVKWLIHFGFNNALQLCLFFLPATAVIPLHNHPGMTVFNKLLLGTMHIKSYDLADPVNSVNTGLPSQRE